MAQVIILRDFTSDANFKDTYAMSRSLIKVNQVQNHPSLGCYFFMHLYIIKIIMAQVIILMRLYFTCKLQDTYAMTDLPIERV